MDLWDKFNDAPGWKVALGTLGTLGAAYFLTKFIQDPEGTKTAILGSLIKGARTYIPGVSGKVTGEIDKQMDELKEKLLIKGVERFFEIPAEGWSPEAIVDLMTKIRDAEEHNWKVGNVSGVVYNGDQEHTEVMNKALCLFSLSNPLHPDVFPSIKKFEAEIVSMAVNMLAPGVEGVCGAVTSGGSESILMAVKAHRDYYAKRKGITRPEMVIPVSAHAAFEKAASYFKVKLVHVPLGDDFRVDVNAVRRAITPNTVLIVGSAPSYSFGMIDPIEELGALALKHDIGLHVDSCLGGFILPWFQKLDLFHGRVPAFDFRVPGVTSISADTHKYGYAVKGTSCLLFRNKELRQSMFFITTEWPGGAYASPSMAGSRPGCLIAACWASLIHMGVNGFMNAARGIAEAQIAIKEGIKQIPEVELCGDSYSTVVGFRAVHPESLNIFAVMSAIHEKGWVLNALQKPNSIHLCLTYRHVGKAEQFLNDLKASIAEVQSDPVGWSKKGAAPVYGLAYGLPDRDLIGQTMYGYLDALLTA